MEFTVRIARAQDTAGITTVKRLATASTHGPALEDTERYAALIGEPNGLVLLAETGSETIGFAALRCESHASVGSRNPVQLWQIYVLPAYHGSGAAARLMDTAVERMRQRGHDVLWLGVSEGNLRAIAFYLRHGFRSLGVHAVGTGEHVHRDLVMTRALS